jgi:hypothetical protein
MIITKDSAIKLVIWITIIFGFVSAYTTYLGAADMIDPSKPWYFRIIPWGIAIVAFLFSAVVYIFYFNVFPVANPRTRIALAATIPLFVIGMFSMSTMLSVIAFGGDAVMQYHLDATIQNADRKLNGLIRSLGREQELVTTLRQLSQQFKALSGAESQGGITRVVGTGGTTITLAMIGKIFNEMQEIAAGNKDEIETLRVKGTNLITELRALNQSGLPLGEKIAKFAVKLNDLNGVFSSLQGLSVVRSVKAVSTGLDKLVLQTPNTSTRVGKAQSGAMLKVFELVDSAERIIGEEAADLISEAVQVEPLNVINVGAAIFEYAPEIRVAWGAALAADFAGLVFIVILIIAWPFLGGSSRDISPYDVESEVVKSLAASGATRLP